MTFILEKTFQLKSKRRCLQKLKDGKKLFRFFVFFRFLGGFMVFTAW